MDRTYTDIASMLNDRSLFTEMASSTILITGATGQIGSMLMKTLSAANEKYDLRIKIIGQIRDKEKAKQVFGSWYQKLDYTKVPKGSFDYIVHTVSPTKSKYFIEYPVETIQASVGSTMKILEAAKSCGASVVYLSSMEQYGVPYEHGQRMTEDRIGIVDHLNVRSSYSESKRMCECLCVAYAKEYGLNVKIARLAQTFGAGIPLTDNRMPMQFAKAVVENRDIVLHTEGNSISNFVYLTDAIIGILTILERGEPGQAYNICHDKETRSVREIAEMVANNVAAGRIKVRVEKRENMGYAPDVAMYLDSGKLRRLGWEPRVDMIEAYRRLVEHLKS